MDVTDPRTGKKFRFYDFEYQLALQLNGRPLAEVAQWATSAYEVELTAAGIAEFGSRLAELGFIEGTPAPVAGTQEITDMGAGPTAVAPAQTVPETTDMNGGPTAVSPAGTLAETTDMGAVATAVSPAGTVAESTDTNGSRPPGSKLPGAAGIPPHAPATDAGDSPESDWTAQPLTATFVPDSAMLVPSLDRTPVASDFPYLKDAETTPTPTPLVPASGLLDPGATASESRSADAGAAGERKLPDSASLFGAGISSTSSDATPPPLPHNGHSMGPSEPLLPDPKASRADSDALPGTPTWASTLEGGLRTGPIPADAGATPPPLAVPSPSAQPLGSDAAAERVGAAPPGVPERRQPPQPEAVVMSGFSANDDLVAPPKKGAGRILLVLFLLAAVAGAVGYVMWGRAKAAAPQALRVRALSPTPTAVYRWFSGHGLVADAEPRALTFQAPGRLLELLPSGTEFGAGELLGRLHGSAAVETLLAHHRSRLAFYEQVRESMSASGNAIEARQAELKRAEKQRLVEETSAALARVTLRSWQPGEVVETLAKVGTSVKAGVPVMRIKERILHGDFHLQANELEAAAKLELCRVEVIGLGLHASNDEEPRRPGDPVADAAPTASQHAPRFVDCERPARAGENLSVALPSDVGLVPGQPLRLARQRLDAVFPVPAEAVEGEGAERAVWIAGRDGLAERRTVTLADVDGNLAYVASGLRVGEAVIVEAPAGLAAGAPVVTAP